MHNSELLRSRILLVRGSPFALPVGRCMVSSKMRVNRPCNDAWLPGREGQLPSKAVTLLCILMSLLSSHTAAQPSITELQGRAEPDSEKLSLPAAPLVMNYTVSEDTVARVRREATLGSKGGA